MEQNGPILINNIAATPVKSEDVAVGSEAVGYSTGWKLVDLSSFALQYQLAASGSPSVKLEYEQSTNGTDWYAPDNASNIVTATSGKLLHGIQLTSLITVKYLRIKITELAVIADTVITLKLSAQKRYAA